MRHPIINLLVHVVTVRIIDLILPTVVTRHEKETARFRPPRRFAQAVPRGLGKVVDVQRKTEIMVKPPLPKCVQRKLSREPGLHVFSLEPKLANRD